MNPPLLPEVTVGPQPTDQPSLNLATEGVQRYVWHSAFGEILIEARDGVAYVNGQRVMSIAELRYPAAVVEPAAGGRPDRVMA
jgi:hypothetical protein